MQGSLVLQKPSVDMHVLMSLAGLSRISAQQVDCSDLPGISVNQQQMVGSGSASAFDQGLSGQACLLLAALQSLRKSAVSLTMSHPDQI